MLSYITIVSEQKENGKIRSISSMKKGDAQIIFWDTPKGVKKCLLLSCPKCGANAFTSSHEHTWKGKLVTISPSLRCHRCTAHYYIRNNQIEWL